MTLTLEKRHEPFRTKIALAIELVEAAIRRKGPFGVVVFDAWYVAEMWSNSDPPAEGLDQRAQHQPPAGRSPAFSGGMPTAGP